MDFDDFQLLRGKDVQTSPSKKKKKSSSSKKKSSRNHHAKTKADSYSAYDDGATAKPDSVLSLSEFFDAHQHPTSLSSISQDSQSAAPAPRTPKQTSKQRQRQNSFSGMELTLSKFFNQEERLGLSKHKRSCSLDMDNEDSFHLDDRSIQSAPTVTRNSGSFSAPTSPMNRHHHRHHHHDQRRSIHNNNKNQHRHHHHSHEGILPPPSPGGPTTPKTPGRKKITRNKSTPTAALKAMVSPLRRAVPRRSYSFGEKSSGIQKPHHRDSFSTASTQSLGSSWSTSTTSGNAHGGHGEGSNGWKEWEKSPPKKKSYLKGRFQEENGKEDKKRRTFLKDRISDVIGKEDAFAMLMLHELNSMDW